MANLFALRCADPRFRAHVVGKLRSVPGWTRVQETGEWIAAEAPLPGPPGVSPPPGIFFAEGKDTVATAIEDSAVGGWDGVARLALDAPDRLAILPGDFGFVALAEDGRAAVVRSCGGVVPFHLYEGRGVVAVATRVGDLLRFVPVPLEPDPLVWAAFASSAAVFPDDRSHVAGSCTVPRGHAAVVRSPETRATRSRAAFVQYFDPRPDRWPEPTPQRRAEHVERLRSLLLANLRRDLDPGGGNLLSLSGGVDSSSLGAIAVSELGIGVETLSIIPAPDVPGAARERQFVESLARSVGFTRQTIMDPDVEEWLDLATQVPDVGFPVPHNLLCALPRVLDPGPVRVLFGGENADEVCGAAVTLPDWAMATKLRALVAGLGALPTGWKDPLRWGAWRFFWAVRRPRTYLRTSLPDLFDREIREEYAEWFLRHVATGAPPGPWRFLTMWLGQDGWIGMGWEVASTLGIRRSMPFLTREMLELVYDCHPSELVGPGLKRLLRESIDGMVPHAHLYRPDRGTLKVRDPRRALAWGRALPDPVTPFLDPSWRDTRAGVAYPEILVLTLLERAGRSFEALRAGGAFPVT